MVINHAKIQIISRKNKPPPFRNPLTNKPKLNTMTINYLSILLAA